MKFTIATVLALAAVAFAYPAVDNGGCPNTAITSHIESLLIPPSPRQAPEHRDQPRRLGPGHDGRQRERRALRGQQGLPGQQGQGAISVFSSSTLGHHDNGAMGHPAPIRVDYAARLHTTMRH